MKPVKVFIAGSRAISRLNDPLRQRLDRIIAEGHSVLVGDANGADKIVQKHLADHRYADVVVYCTGMRCRNNVANWPTHPTPPPAGVHGGFEFYAAKDRAMASDATHGLMLWDGESRGTFTNINNLVSEGKPVVVYVGPSKSFMNVKTQSDIDALLELANPVGRQKEHHTA